MKKKVSTNGYTTKALKVGRKEKEMGIDGIISERRHLAPLLELFEREGMSHHGWNHFREGKVPLKESFLRECI